ncbi:MAG: hypothetical protein NDI61_07580 [Bdellovibrionaceae bacterium]|nr:hypothetical protein [Pseudobdellovibrionaceae bacterium]
MHKSVYGSIAIALTAVLSVACGSGGGRTLIERAEKKIPGADSKLGMDGQCANGTPAGRAGKVSLPEGVKVCVWSGGDQLSEQERRAAHDSEYALGTHYKPKSFDVNAKLEVTEETESRQGVADGKPKRSVLVKKGVKAHLRVMLNLPEEMSKDDANHVRKFIENTCVRTKIEPLWSREMNKRFNLDLELVLPTDSDVDEVHQELDVIVSPAAVTDSKSRPQLAMNDWPFHSYLAPAGHPVCDTKCASEEGGVRRRNCLAACVVEMSEPFCRSLGKLSAHWLGQADALADKQCLLAENEKHPHEGDIKMGYRKSLVSQAAEPAAQVAAADVRVGKEASAGEPSTEMNSADTADSGTKKSSDWSQLKIGGGLSEVLNEFCGKKAR